MTEIISFPPRIRFATLRAFNAHAGLGEIVAVFWTPAHFPHAEQGGRPVRDAYPALVDLANAGQTVVSASAIPAPRRNRDG